MRKRAFDIGMLHGLMQQEPKGPPTIPDSFLKHLTSLLTGARPASSTPHLSEAAGVLGNPMALPAGVNHGPFQLPDHPPFLPHGGSPSSPVQLPDHPPFLPHGELTGSPLAESAAQEIGSAGQSNHRRIPGALMAGGLAAGMAHGVFRAARHKRLVNEAAKRMAALGAGLPKMGSLDPMGIGLGALGGLGAYGAARHILAPKDYGHLAGLLRKAQSADKKIPGETGRAVGTAGIVMGGDKLLPKTRNAIALKALIGSLGGSSSPQG